MTFDEWEIVYSSQFVRILNPSDEFVEDMAREKAGRKEAWNAARTEARAEALKEAAETAANASDSRECTDPHHDTRYCSTCQHVSLGCEVAARAIEAKMK